MFKDVGTSFGRMKHSAMVSVGKAQVTKDPEFDENSERIRVQKSVVSKMQSDCKRYLNALRSLSKCHYELAESIRDFYLASDPSQKSLKDLSVNYFASAEQLRAIDTEVEQELQQDFIAPIEIYLTEMKSTFKKIEARNNKRDDMDRLSRYAGHPDAEKAGLYQRSADAFAALNAELLVELPHVFKTRTEFFDPLFKTLLEVQEKCYGKLASMEQHSAAASGVNRQSIRDFKLHPENTDAPFSADPPASAGPTYGAGAAGPTYGAAAGAAAGAGAAAATRGAAAGGPTYGQPQPSGPTYGQPAGGPTYGGPTYGQPQPGAGPGPMYGGAPAGRAGPPPGARGGPPPGGRGGPPPGGRGGPPGGRGGPTYGGPTYGAGGPAYGAGGPAYGAGGPTYGAGGPTYGAGGPTYGAGGPTYGAPAGRGGGAPPPTPPPKAAARKAKALYQFQAEESNEISFNVGDTIIITRAEEGGEWWLGKVDGTTHEGLFPSAYVQDL